MMENPVPMIPVIRIQEIVFLPIPVMTEIHVPLILVHQADVFLSQSSIVIMMMDAAPLVVILIKIMIVVCQVEALAKATQNAALESV
jgi:hypothetical protein